MIVSKPLIFSSKVQDLEYPHVRYLTFSTIGKLIIEGYSDE